MAEKVASEKGTLRKEKYPMDGVEKLLRATVTTFPMLGRFHRSCLYECHQSRIYFTIL